MPSFRSLAVLMLGWFTIPLLAQTWCPPGAVWHDNVIGWALTGCETRTYTGDTLIQGQLCQTIHVRNRTYSYWDEELSTAEYDMHTRLDNGVVYALWSEDGTWYSDTLYWLTAPVGARWNVFGAEGMCPDGERWVEVLSIEDRVINGLTLQVRQLGNDNLSGEMVVTAEMIDRIGTPLHSIPPPCVIGEAFGVTVSYHDDLWEGFDSGETSNCERFPNSLRELQGAQLHTLSFGPDGRTLTIQAARGSGGLYALYDVHGKSIQHGRYSGGGTTIGLGELTPAMYLVRLTTGSGQQEVVKFQIP
jgi:hypothetical protein